MKIYFAHSKDFDYINEYYLPIENSKLKNEELIFPHKTDKNSNNDRDFYSNLDLFIGEVSYPSTGLGIELGYVFDDKVPTYCFYKKGTKPSGSVYSVTNNVYEYDSISDLVDKVIEIVEGIR